MNDFSVSSKYYKIQISILEICRIIRKLTRLKDLIRYDNGWAAHISLASSRQKLKNS